MEKWKTGVGVILMFCLALGFTLGLLLIGKETSFAKSADLSYQILEMPDFHCLSHSEVKAYIEASTPAEIGEYLHSLQETQKKELLQQQKELTQSCIFGEQMETEASGEYTISESQSRTFEEICEEAYEQAKNSKAARDTLRYVIYLDTYEARADETDLSIAEEYRSSREILMINFMVSFEGSRLKEFSYYCSADWNPAICVESVTYLEGTDSFRIKIHTQFDSKEYYVQKEIAGASMTSDGHNYEEALLTMSGVTAASDPMDTSCVMNVYRKKYYAAVKTVKRVFSVEKNIEEKKQEVYEIGAVKKNISGEMQIYQHTYLAGTDAYDAITVAGRREASYTQKTRCEARVIEESLPHYFDVSLDTKTLSGLLQVKLEIERSDITMTPEMRQKIPGEHLTLELLQDIRLEAPNALKRGYSLSGWKHPDGMVAAGQRYDAGSDIDWSAQWTPNTYRVSYDGNGGSVLGASFSDVTYRDGNPLDKQCATRTGYTFIGWALSPDATGIIKSFEEPVPKWESKQGVSDFWGYLAEKNGLTLYAIWTLSTSGMDSVAFFEDSGFTRFLGKVISQGEKTARLVYPNTDTMHSSDGVLLPSYSYRLAGGLKVRGVIAYDQAKNATSYAIDGAIAEVHTLYGYVYVWDSSIGAYVQETEKCRAMGSTKQPEGNTYRFDETTVLSFHPDSRLYDLFCVTLTKNVSEDSPRGTVLTLPTTIALEGEKADLYCNLFFVPKTVETKALTLTFDPNGGRFEDATFSDVFENRSGCAVKAVEYSSLYGQMPRTPVREGYEFAGWFTAKLDGHPVASSDTFLEKENQILYAHWQRGSYPVSFDAQANGGQKILEHGAEVGIDGLYSMDVEYENAVPISQVTAEKTGYTFVGWSLQVDSDSVVTTTQTEIRKRNTKPLVLYAVFQKTFLLHFRQPDDSVDTVELVFYNRRENAVFSTPELLECAGWIKNYGWSYKKDPAAEIYWGEQYETPVTKAELLELGKGEENIDFYGTFYRNVMLSYDLQCEEKELEAQTNDAYFSTSGKKQEAVFTLYEAPERVGYRFIDWWENDYRYAPKQQVKTTRDIHLTAEWDAYPSLYAPDRYFTLEEAKKGSLYENLLSTVEVSDDHTLPEKCIVITNYEEALFTELTASADYVLQYRVTDSVGNTTEAQNTVHVVDTQSRKPRIKKEVRFFSNEYYRIGDGTDRRREKEGETVTVSPENGGLHERSLWRNNVEYAEFLEEAMERKITEKPLCYRSDTFTKADREAVRDYVILNPAGGFANYKNPSGLMEFVSLFLLGGR